MTTHVASSRRAADPASPHTDELGTLLGESAAHPGTTTGDDRRRRIGFVAGPLVFLGLALAPVGLTQTQQTLAAILGLVVVYWVSEAIPVPATALAALALCALLGVAPPNEIFSAFARP